MEFDDAKAKLELLESRVRGFRSDYVRGSHFDGVVNDLLAIAKGFVDLVSLGKASWGRFSAQVSSALGLLERYLDALSKHPEFRRAELSDAKGFFPEGPITYSEYIVYALKNLLVSV